MQVFGFHYAFSEQCEVPLVFDFFFLIIFFLPIIQIQDSETSFKKFIIIETL